MRLRAVSTTRNLNLDFSVAYRWRAKYLVYGKKNSVVRMERSAIPLRQWNIITFRLEKEPPSSVRQTKPHRAIC
ncbi:uncharacterized protein LOC143236986 isoform X2 [Tachypleus tridentatus]|uniref:uncharacterized protein LOC143236986 isoform X2 n=1 Tax=Tachypleus tridentatus TaxID=6853 RepID=UPI003FD48362